MIVGLSGVRGSGKDVAAHFLVKNHGFTRVALADPMRDILYAMNPIVSTSGDRLQNIVDTFGWDAAKRSYPEARRLMVAFGTEGGREVLYPDFWIDTAKRLHPDLTKPNSRYVVTDIRFPNEAQWVIRTGGVVCWISRPGIEIESTGHKTEQGLARPYADIEVLNDGTPEDLGSELYARITNLYQHN